MAEHNTLTGSALHEMKGAAAASIHTLPVADGAGSTAFAKIDTDNMDTASIFNVNQFFFTVSFLDISTAASQYVALPVACTIVRIEGALQGAIATANTILTFRNNAGTSMGDMTIAYSGSAAGDVDTLSPASNNTFTAGQRMKIDSDGGSTNAVNEQLTFYCTRTA